MKEYIVDFNDILDKVASLSPISDESIETLAYVFQKKAQSKEIAYFEKILGPGGEGAYSKLSKADEKKIEKFVNVKFTSVHNVKNGSFIVFPEAHKKEVSMTHGIVFKLKDNKTMVVSNDGRVVVLRNQEPFICIPVDNQSFTLNTMPIKALSIGDCFFVIRGNEAKEPLIARRVSPMSTLEEEFGFINPRESNINKDKRHSIGKIINVDDAKSLYVDSSNKDYDWNSSKNKHYTIKTLKNADFEDIENNEYMRRKSEETGLTQDRIKEICELFGYSKNNNIIAADEDYKVFKILGPLTGYVKSQNDYELIKNATDAGYGIDEMEKVAIDNNKIVLTCIDRKLNRFNLSIDYKDTSSRFMQGRNISFNNITKAKAKAILRILGYQGSKLSECIFKAKNEPRCIVPVPASCTLEDINKLEGGEMTNTSKEAVKDVLNQYANPYTIAKAVGIATTAGLLLNAGNVALVPALAGTKPAVDGVRVLSKILKNAESASIGLEKVANSQESDVILDYAKAVTIAHNYIEKVASVISDDKNIYPGLKDITLEVLKARPVYEKIAYDLTGYKVNQRLQGQEIISPSVIGNAIDSLDNLVKIANAVNNAMDLEKLSFIDKKNKEA